MYYMVSLVKFVLLTIGKDLKKQICFLHFFEKGFDPVEFNGFRVKHDFQSKRENLQITV